MIRSEIENLRDRIWITERCHIKAEKRNRFLELYFHIVLALYSLASISTALFSGGAESSTYSGLNTFTSIFTLSISLLIFGFKFGETAAEHRSCYLELQKIRLLDGLDVSSMNNKYIDCLAHYPNHTSADYLSVVVSDIFKPKQATTNPNGDPIELSGFCRASFAARWLTLRVMMVIFLVSPAVFFAASLGAFDAILTCEGERQ